jgi:hypothetical protein
MFLVQVCDCEMGIIIESKEGEVKFWEDVYVLPIWPQEVRELQNLEFSTHGKISHPTFLRLKNDSMLFCLSS